MAQFIGTLLLMIALIGGFTFAFSPDGVGGGSVNQIILPTPYRAPIRQPISPIVISTEDTTDGGFDGIGPLLMMILPLLLRKN